MNLPMAEAWQAGAETVIGEYIATPRNALVADFYPRMGFTTLENQLRSATRYRAQPAFFKPLKHFIDAKLC